MHTTFQFLLLVQVCHSIMNDNFSAARCKEVTVVRVPVAMTPDFVRFNQDMANASPLLPSQSPKMCWAALTKQLHQTCHT